MVMKHDISLNEQRRVKLLPNTSFEILKNTEQTTLGEVDTETKLIFKR